MVWEAILTTTIGGLLVVFVVWIVRRFCTARLPRSVGVWLLALPGVYCVYHRCVVYTHPGDTRVEKSGWMDFSDEAIKRSESIQASYKRLDELHGDVRLLQAERKLGRWRLLGHVLGRLPLRLLWTRKMSAKAWDCLKIMWPVVKYREPWCPVFTVGFNVFDVPEGEKTTNAYGALSCFNLDHKYATACHELHNRGYLEEHLVRGRLYTYLSDSGRRFIYLSGLLLGGYSRLTGEALLQVSEQEQTYIIIRKDSE